MDQLIFTRSIFLWGLFGAALPLVIHLINRHRARRKRFAAMDFLFRVQKMSARKILLKQILLLIIRTLLIVFLVLAASGPALQDRKSAEKDGPISLAIVVDCSFSMRAKRDDSRSMFDAALDQARSTILSMGPSDRACLVAAGAKNEVVISPCSDSRSDLLSAIDKLKVGWSGCDLNEAISISAGLLKKAKEPNKKILVLSDAAASAFSGGTIEKTDDLGLSVVVFDVAKGQDRSNGAVVDIDSLMDSGMLRVAAHLVQYGQQGRVPVKVDLDGSPAAKGVADLNEAQVSVKTFSLHPRAKKIHTGRVSLSHDHLPGDDEQEFYVSEKGKTRVLLVDGDMRTVVYRDELFYVEHALGTNDSTGASLSFTTITPDRLDGSMLGGADVVFLANVRHLAAEAMSCLEDFVASGGGLFISMGDKIDVDQFNRDFGKLLPWRLRDVVSLGDDLSRSGEAQGIEFDWVDEKHPLVMPLGPGYELSLKAVKTRRAVVIEPGSGVDKGHVVLRYSNGASALLDGSYGSGRVLMFTSSLDLDWTNWPSRATFLPFVLSAARYLAGVLDTPPPARVDVGGSIEIKPGEGTDGIEIRKPDGKTVTLPILTGSNRKLTFSQTDIPGWYEIIRSGNPVHRSGMPGFFVRIAPSESDTRPITLGRLGALFKGSARVVMTASGRTDFERIAWIFIVLCLVLVLCEGILIRH